MTSIIRLWKATRPAAAFDACVQPHIPRLFRLAWRLTGSEEEAEDLLQETLLRVYPKRGEVLQLDAPAPWLAKVMHNAWVDRWRRSGIQRITGSLDDPGLNVPEPCSDDTTILQMVNLSLLQHAVMALPEHHRAVFIMHDAEGYTLQEISDITGDPLGTLKSRLHRARESLRKILKEDHLDGTFSPPAASQG